MSEKPVSGEPDRSGSRRIGPIAVIAVLAIAAVAGVVLMRGGCRGGAPGRSADGEPLLEVGPEAGAEQAPSSPQLTVKGPLEGVLPVRHGDVMHLELVQVEAAGSLRFEFELPAQEARDAQSKPRIYAAHLAPVELEVIETEGDRNHLRLDVPAGTISAPGRYIVEVRSDVKSPFPLRRFSVEVR